MQFGSREMLSELHENYRVFKFAPLKIQEEKSFYEQGINAIIGFQLLLRQSLDLFVPQGSEINFSSFVKADLIA